MIERRVPVAPMSILRPPRQTPGASQKRRVRFAESTPVARREPVTKNDLVLRTPRWRKIQRLERRFYTPLGLLRHGEQNRRLWRMKPGLYELFFFVRQYREATLREAGSLELLRVRLPRRMEWPWKSTHLKIHKPGEDPSYPRGKAEWIRR